MIAAPLAQTGIRMVAVDYSGKYEVAAGNVSNINITLDETPVLIEMELQDILDQTVAEMLELLPGANPIYQSIQTNANGIEYALLIITFERDVFGIPVRDMQAMYQLEAGLLRITGVGHEDSFQVMERTFKNAFASLNFIE